MKLREAGRLRFFLASQRRFSAGVQLSRIDRGIDRGFTGFFSRVRGAKMNVHVSYKVHKMCIRDRSRMADRFRLASQGRQSQIESGDSGSSQQPDGLLRFGSGDIGDERFLPRARAGWVWTSADCG